MNYAGNTPLLFDLHGDDEAFAANSNEFVLHRPALGESAQVALQRVLNVAALLFRLTPNARQLR